jgi:hypothetical protein
MINLSNRLLLTTSLPPSIEYITGSVKTGDIVITNTGSATSADYNYSAPSWTLLGKIWGGYWAGGGLPQYRNWAGLHAKIITSDGESLSIPNQINYRIHRMHKPIQSFSASAGQSTSLPANRSYSDPNNGTDAYIVIDYTKVWASPSNRTTNIQPDHNSSWTNNTMYTKAFLTGEGSTVSLSGPSTDPGPYGNGGQQNPQIYTTMTLSV